MSRAARAAAWLAGLLAAGVALRLSATGPLATPPLGSAGALVDWVDEREPVDAALALVRLAAELAVWYVLAVSALHAAGSLLRLAGAHRLADALALPAVARLVRAGLGVGVVAASAVAGADVSPTTRGTAAMVPVLGSGTAVAAPSSGTAVMRPLPPEVSDAPEAPAADAVAPAPPPTSWTVQAGDSLWSIAEELLADAWGRPASDAEVDPYWRVLVERNRGRLVDPDEPDLIHPGQVLEVPPVPSPAA